VALSFQKEDLQIETALPRVLPSTSAKYPLPFCAPSLCHQSIKSYLSAIRYLQISSGSLNPALSSFAHLDSVLKGVRRTGEQRPRRTNHPRAP
jgi:hypothetical protein